MHRINSFSPSGLKTGFQRDSYFFFPILPSITMKNVPFFSALAIMVSPPGLNIGSQTLSNVSDHIEPSTAAVPLLLSLPTPENFLPSGLKTGRRTAFINLLFH